MSIAKAVQYLQQGEWERAHALVQDDATRAACWAHGIVHLQEGDTENARYWFARAKRPFSGDVASELAALSAATAD